MSACLPRCSSIPASSPSQAFMLLLHYLCSGSSADGIRSILISRHRPNKAANAGKVSLSPKELPTFSNGVTEERRTTWLTSVTSLRQLVQLRGGATEADPGEQFLRPSERKG